MYSQWSFPRKRNVILQGKEFSGKGGSIQNSKNSFRGVSKRMAENALELIPSWYWHFKENFQVTYISITESPILKQPTVEFWGTQVLPLCGFWGTQVLPLWVFGYTGHSSLWVLGCTGTSSLWVLGCAGHSSLWVLKAMCLSHSNSQN